MKELQTDLSKLPEQDFANASWLKEAVEVQAELKMAEDALTKKSVDIAVPLEQLGYERAEELVTNIEKWLPDTPDREKWSQEESLTDKDKEAPMAELPGELEDMIGDLMEQEEDLFDEMEDVLQQRGRFARQRRRLGRDGRPDLEHERQGRDRQPAAEFERDRRPVGRRAAGEIERRVRGRRGGGQGRPQHAQPAHARSVRQGPDQGPQQGLGGRRDRRRQGKRPRRRRARRPAAPLARQARHGASGGQAGGAAEQGRRDRSPVPGATTSIRPT